MQTKRIEYNFDMLTVYTTYKCNRACNNCAAGCGKFKIEGDISIEQFEYILDQLKSNRHHLKVLYIAGGEALLHPQISEILDLSVDYQKKIDPKCILVLMTNGVKTPGLDISDKLKNFRIANSYKYRARTANEPVSFGIAPQHNSVFVAPIDVGIECEFTHGCSLLGCGFTVNKWGFYMCGACHMIDFIMGADIGVKKMQDCNIQFEDQRKAFCRYCGFLKYWDSFPLVVDEPISPTWLNLKANFDKQKPKLTPIC